MTTSYADVVGVVRQAMAAWAPPPKLSLSQWADKHFRLSAESSAEPGPWRTLPYQREIMDAFTDPTVEKVSVMKSARVGWTKILNAFIAYCIHWDPCSVLLVQPTVDDAKGYSKEEIAPMLRDCPDIGSLVMDEEEGPKDSANTILHKRYPGGVLSMVGANSGTGFRRVSKRAVLFDEADGYPPSAGADGDPIELGIKRTQTFWNRKIGAGSTPLLAGRSRIEQLFLEGDQRRYHVPCPHCGHCAPLVFRGDKGHAMMWPDGDPRSAYFVCQRNGCIIEHKDKHWMVEHGRWVAEQPFRGHASFHIWAAYSYAANATWGQLAEEFIVANKRAETLRSFVNLVLGETWQERGDAPEWERLYARRESYALGTVPSAAVALTAGVDVQKDRWVYEVVAWGPGKESWSVDAGVIMGDTSNEAEWAKMDDFVSRTYAAPGGVTWVVQCVGMDSGYNANQVYSFARRHPRLVMALKGHASAAVVLSAPKPVDINLNGKRIARGCKLWMVGVDIVKRELLGWMRLPSPLDGESCPPGYMHFPMHGDDYFKQLTAEQLVERKDKHGFARQEWEVIAGRENHFLDARVYSRAAAAGLGIDRMPRPAARDMSDAPVRSTADAAALAQRVNRETPGEPMDAEQLARPAPRAKPPRKSGWLSRGGDRFSGRGKPWL